MSETTTNGPVLESLAARVGVAGLVFLSAKVGWDFWIGRGEVVLAWLTIAAELVAFAGLSLALWHWNTNRRRALTAAGLTVLAALWCGLTTWEKLSSDREARVLAAAEASLPYQTATREFTDASAALRSALRARAPESLGPLNRAAWNAGQAQTVRDLRAVRREAEEALRRATPEPRLDVVALLRGAGVEIVKLFGFTAFALTAPAPRRGQQPTERPLSPEERSERGRWLVSLRKDRQPKAA